MNVFTCLREEAGEHILLQTLHRLFANVIHLWKNIYHLRRAVSPTLSNEFCELKPTEVRAPFCAA